MRNKNKANKAQGKEKEEDNTKVRFKGRNKMPFKLSQSSKSEDVVSDPNQSECHSIS